MPLQRTSSVWFDPEPALPECPALEEHLEADVCVVGAGIAGLSVAYHFSRAGRRVVVLDSSSVSAGDTARTTAHLASVLDDRFVRLEKRFGEDGARLAFTSHAAAIDRIEEIARDERIDCAFHRVAGFLFLGPNDTPDELREEMKAAQRAGLAASWLDAVPGLAKSAGPCVRFEAQARFQPVAYMAGLARAFLKRGGQIFGDSPVCKVRGGQGAYAETRNGKRVMAGAIVVATNSPVNNAVALHTAMGAYRTYAVALQAPADIPDGLYWDTADPYHYVRFHDGPEGRQLIAGGEDHRTGQGSDAAARFDFVEAWARSLWPACGKRVGFWSGQVLEPADSLAYIGRNPGDEPNVYVATGDSGHGLTHGTIAGMLLSDLILGRENPWAALYDPNRTSLRAPAALAGEALTSASGYSDWVIGGDVRDPAQVKPGSGAIVRLGLAKFAVSRNADGKVCRRSAVCPHLGGLVRWNAAEGTWDCPVHGSRFSSTGEVLNGPACEPLGPAESS